MIILCADDYGLSNGVSRGIVDLCAARRLSATSTIVNLARWDANAQRLLDVRAATAVGLHLNLTLGRPLRAQAGAAHLSADGSLLPLGRIISSALLGRLGRAEIRRECHTQIAAFRDAMGSLPDFIDGHQHVHVLPVVRDALIEAISDFSWPQPPLVRVPNGRSTAILGKRGEVTKHAIVALLSMGFRHKLRAAGLPTNTTFSGFSSFAIGSDYHMELQTALDGDSKCHLVMCPPGHVDAGLADSGDPLRVRRAEEWRGIMAFEQLPERIWHPMREANGCIDWVKAISA